MRRRGPQYRAVLVTEGPNSSAMGPLPCPAERFCEPGLLVLLAHLEKLQAAKSGHVQKPGTQVLPTVLIVQQHSLAVPQRTSGPAKVWTERQCLRAGWGRVFVPSGWQEARNWQDAPWPYFTH